MAPKPLISKQGVKHRASGSKLSSNSASFILPSVAEDSAEKIEEFLAAESENKPIPAVPMSELEATAQNIESTINDGSSPISSSKAAGKQKQIDDESLDHDVEELMNLPSMLSKPTANTVANQFKSGVKISDLSESTPPAEDTSDEDKRYAESFATEQETADIRDHIATLDNKINNMQTLLETLINERENLPRHLARAREENNAQFTIIADKLHTALEHATSPNVIKQAKEHVEKLSSDSDHVLTTLQTDLTSDADPKSATASHEPIKISKKKTILRK